MAIEPAELDKVTFSPKVTQMNMVRNEYIRGTAQVERSGITVGKGRLREMFRGGRGAAKEEQGSWL